LFASALVAFAIMERALITRDFTVKYVAENGSSHTPALFNFAALWGALEGSILLWGLILTIYLCAVLWRFRKRLGDKLLAWATLVMFAVALFFFGLMATAASPFRSFSPPAGFDGPGPNPLLQNNLLMAYHPPFLYLGFVGFTVPFAFAIGALITGRLGEGWLVETRRWTLFAFAFLTIGIVAGAWWSYEVLGWGGYWAWDPVENASFLPWLTGTAYLHSVMVQERRGMLRVWNLSLLCATFSLTILGTFLTRSGVLNSVHAFSNSGIGPALLTFFGVIVAVCIGLIFWRGDRLRSPGRIDSPISREGAFLVNNLLFATFALVVLLGTVFPLIIEALNQSEITVGAPYFNRMTGPIVIALLFLMGVAPALPWRKTSAETLRQRLLVPAWVGAGTVVIAVAVGARGIVPLVVFGLGGFVAGASGRQLVLATRRQGIRGLVGRTNGGMIVHIGVVVIALGVVASTAYTHQADFTLEQGNTAHIEGHSVTYLGSSTRTEGNVIIQEARIRIDGSKVYAPKLKKFSNANQVVGTPSVRSTPVSDVYLSVLTLPEQANGTITMRVYVEPMVSWIWFGGGLIFIGSFFAAFPGRRRVPTDPVSSPIGPVASGRTGDDAPGTSEPVGAGALDAR
ncbi:MAG: heme lyase CcmF/NrfE family subunit, partial [Actinobacteria bacterium]|nr:heme lyase CcmF/NrfE family subunit [Actinomycetota bacterium]